jgi:uncharacterized protein YxjI
MGAYEYVARTGVVYWSETQRLGPFSIADSYRVCIDPGQNEVLILAITVAVDMMAHG